MSTSPSYYLILSEYVGPNRRDSRGNVLGDTAVMHICTEPGRTNLSREARISGWLGTTNDTSETAYGEFATLDEARAEAHRLGYTAEPRRVDDAAVDLEEDEVERWVTPEAAREQWDADEWFNGLGRRGTCAAYGITADSTDSEVSGASDVADAEAVAENVELHGSHEFILELRDELRAQEWNDADTAGRITQCANRYRVSIFAARRDDPPGA